MLHALSKLKGYSTLATDGSVGTVNDVLFDDSTWKTRWLVIDTGHWLTGRKVLISPSAIGGIDEDGQSVTVNLTRARIKDSPEIGHDQPVSRQMETGLYGYYGWDPLWGGSGYGMGAMAAPVSGPPYFGGLGRGEPSEIRANRDDQDPHLRSVAEVHGYHVHATDGDIGHVEDLVVEDAGWAIRYLVIDTRNWWAGQHVLVSPFAVREISWGDRQMRLDITRETIKASPPWQAPLSELDQIYAGQLDGHYGWPAYSI